ncbi:heme exporter protein CcmD [Ruegeria sp. Ofav3-42]|uniref:heme exporter protein CcmD n=1 Tax=Ruegeria sp. Ofav3-42 TaxID=2917759 RepID=UPI001EF3DE08|nr:heme exporter protein CcmD [Ruegeria sp. Ofav3-42]MCG7521322.1 heme exporter protein CcmD [Ruegeria sp. Ofav3-42]
MIPDLGKYADTVLWSYAASLGLLAALIVVSVMRGRKVRAEMEKVENRMTRNG